MEKLAALRTSPTPRKDRFRNAANSSAKQLAFHVLFLSFPISFLFRFPRGIAYGRKLFSHTSDNDVIPFELSLNLEEFVRITAHLKIHIISLCRSDFITGDSVSTESAIKSA